MHRDPSGDQSSSGAGHGKSRGGFQIGSVPADLSLQILLVNGRKVSTAHEEVPGEGGSIGGWYVRERDRLGHSSNRSNTYYYRGWYRSRPRIGASCCDGRVIANLPFVTAM